MPVGLAGLEERHDLLGRLDRQLTQSLDLRPVRTGVQHLQRGPVLGLQRREKVAQEVKWGNKLGLMRLRVCNICTFETVSQY